MRGWPERRSMTSSRLFATSIILTYTIRRSRFYLVYVSIPSNVRAGGSVAGGRFWKILVQVGQLFSTLDLMLDLAKPVLGRAMARWPWVGMARPPSNLK